MSTARALSPAVSPPAQALAVPPSARRRWIWAAAMPGLWALAWDRHQPRRDRCRPAVHRLRRLRCGDLLRSVWSAVAGTPAIFARQEARTTPRIRRFRRRCDHHRAARHLRRRRHRSRHLDALRRRGETARLGSAWPSRPGAPRAGRCPAAPLRWECGLCGPSHVRNRCGRE